MYKCLFGEPTSGLSALLSGPQLVVPDHGRHDRMLPNWRDHPAAEWAFTCLAFQPRREHARIRRVVNTYFTARQVGRLRPQIVHVVGELLDAIAGPLCDRGVVDLQEMVGFRLPVAVIGAMLGIPANDLSRFRRSFGDILRVMDSPLDSQTLDRADASMREVQEYFAELIDDRWAHPGEDVLSAILSAGDVVSASEIVALVLLLFTGGFETTTLTIGIGIHALLTHREQWHSICARRVASTQVVDEVLRWDCVVQRVTRVTSEAIEVAGIDIPDDSTVAILLGSANRDAEIYSTPDRFDVTRTGTRLMTFGGGLYGCLGYALAHQELEILFAELAARFPELAPVGEPTRREGNYLRGFDVLPVALS